MNHLRKIFFINLAAEVCSGCYLKIKSPFISRSIKNNSKSIFIISGIYKAFCLIYLFLSGGVLSIQAQQEPNYAAYANIVYRFTKYIDWPDTEKSGDFVIGIVGESPIEDKLKIFTANKKVGNQKIIIKNFSYSSGPYDSQILFICEQESNSLKKIVARTAGASILIITESAGLALKGSCINLLIVDEQLKLEFNRNSIEQRHLHIAPELLGLGTIVK